MPEHWPPPAERERDRKRLDVIRPWHRAGFLILCVGLAALVAWQAAGLWG